MQGFCTNLRDWEKQHSSTISCLAQVSYCRTLALRRTGRMFGEIRQATQPGVASIDFALRSGFFPQDHHIKLKQNEIQQLDS